ncbi:hypothetical protein OIU79_024218 [Salix purpurea]|uniref:Uncharacterized protein n=1 Tax=Salix purpurea TaxID=77065 RepID=A0A9Q0WAY1_SALPP|nr:hypothetical protein OIU79_024218 [Salix purpurea]
MAVTRRSRIKFLSRIRGTQGDMAPESVLNLLITSKGSFSYGMGWDGVVGNGHWNGSYRRHSEQRAGYMVERKDEGRQCNEFRVRNDNRP